jgi:hypothetical protein
MTAAGAGDALGTLAIALVVAEGQCVRACRPSSCSRGVRPAAARRPSAASTWLMIHPLVLGSGRGLFVAEALTSGHFVWPQAGFAVGLDAAEDGLKSRPADTYSRRFRAFSPPPNTRLCGQARSWRLT